MAGTDTCKTPPASLFKKGARAPATPGKDNSTPLCKKCWDKQFGSCLADCVKQQEEQLAATKAKLKKQADFHCKHKEQAAAQAAQAYLT